MDRALGVVEAAAFSAGRLIRPHIENTSRYPDAMDEDLDERWRTGAHPFDGMTLHTGDDPVGFAELLRFVQSAWGAIHDGQTELRWLTLKDWHEHDGFVAQARPITTKAIGAKLAAPSRFRAWCPQEFGVTRLLRDEGATVCLRFGFDPDDDDGRADLTGPQDLLDRMVGQWRRIGGRNLERTAAARFFESRWAG